jgi:hypothetical protein
MITLDFLIPSKDTNRNGFEFNFDYFVFINVQVLVNEYLLFSSVIIIPLLIQYHNDVIRESIITLSYSFFEFKQRHHIVYSHLEHFKGCRTIHSD